MTALLAVKLLVATWVTTWVFHIAIADWFTQSILERARWSIAPATQITAAIAVVVGLWAWVIT